MALTIPPDSIDKSTLRRRVLDWRDKHVDAVDELLVKRIDALLTDIRARLQGASLWDLMVHSKAVGRLEIEPVYREWVKNTTHEVLTHAENELQEIYAITISRRDAISDSPQFPPIRKGGELLILLTAAGGSLALAPFFTFVTVVPAAGILGMLGVTKTVTGLSWPTIAIATALVVFWVLRSVKIKKRISEQYEKSLNSYVHQRIFGQESVASKLKETIKESAGAALQELGR